MAEACCINAYDYWGNFLSTLETLQKENIWVDICYNIPENIWTRVFDYITYIDKCGCSCCLSWEKNLIINTFAWELKTFNASAASDNINFCWSEIFWWNRCKTIIRYKTWSYPISIEDWILAIEETEQNTYSSTWFTLEWLKQQTTYYSKIYALDWEDNILSEKCCSITTPRAFETTCYWYTWWQQSVCLPKWTYKLEVWWAQGGTWCSWYQPRWWYSQWCICIQSNTVLYLYVWWAWTNWNTANGWRNWWWYAHSGNRKTTSWWWWTDIRIWWNTLYHRRIVAWWGWGWRDWWNQWNTSQTQSSWGWTSWLSWYSYDWNCTSSRWGWGWTQTSAWRTGTAQNSETLYAASFWCWWYTSSSSSYWEWWGWGWYWWGAWSADANWWGWSWYVYTSSTCSSAPSWYCHCVDYFLCNAYSCAWNTSFPTAAWWTETWHTWNGCAKITPI